MTQVEKVERRLADEKLSGERVMYGLLAFRIGGVRNTMMGGAAGIAGAAGAAAMAIAAKKGEAVVPSVPLKVPGRVIVALTDQRLLVFSIGGFFVGKPKKLLYSFTFDRVAWLSEPELIPGVAQALRVRIGVADQGVLGIEFPRLQVKDGRNMINRLRRSLPPEPASADTPAT